MLGGETGNTSSGAGPGACVGGGCLGPSHLAGTNTVAPPPPVLVQHPRVVVLLQESQGMGQGIRHWSWVVCFEGSRSCKPAFLGLSPQLSSSLPFHFCDKTI